MSSNDSVLQPKAIDNELRRQKNETSKRRDAPSLKRPASPPSEFIPRKRPGATSRLDSAVKKAALQRREAREEAAVTTTSTGGVADAVRHHYNTVPQRGRDWRRTDSRIKGLRAFNNWVKSTVIHKFARPDENVGQPLRVLDIGCGKGGDLAKWAQATREVELYVGIDPAEVSIEQARERYAQMGRGVRGGGRGRGGNWGGRIQSTFHAEFVVQDAFGQSIGAIPIVQQVGFDAKGGSRWGGGGFDMVSMMFCMHYAFEDEGKARGLLQNIAGALKKGGKFIGTIPNSDILRAKVEEFQRHRGTKPSTPQTVKDPTEPTQTTTNADGDVPPAPQTSTTEAKSSDPRPPTPDTRDHEAEDEVASWGNSIYRVRFPGKTPPDGIFRPPFGWKYNYWLDEAVEVPEYVVPWEAFRALAEDYNLELQYRKPFTDIWKEESNQDELRELSKRMGVIDRYTEELVVTDEEMEAAGFYHAFCFYKV
ncbi:MAG: hypothetical protein Q9216_004720 [Gyalolechia sp. 2 TL-2023]